MLSGIRRFFDKEMAATDNSNSTDDGLALATCALLLEVAESDDEFSGDEREAIIAIVRTKFELDNDQADRLISLATEQRVDSTDMYQFTRLVAEKFDRPRKLAVVESLWRVVWSDGVLEAHEDALMHKLGTLLGVSHRELMALKLRARDS